jgi:putative membrane protein
MNTKHMNTYYKFLLRCSFVLTAVLAFSCSQTLTYQEAVNKNERKITDVAKLQDARFLVDAKSFNILERKLAETAITSGYASAVVDLARKHLDDHKDMQEDLTTLARKEKITLPTMMNDKHQMYMLDVTQSSREDFDNKYIETLQRINEENKEQYMRMATDAKDADIRAFAARKLDMLRDHTTRMEEVRSKLMNTY